MSKSKFFLASRGVMGPVLAIVAVVFASWGIDFSASEQAGLLEQLDKLVLAGTVLVGSVVGIWGRVKASRPLSLTPGAK